jgi:uncharacterized protein (DUF1330 family)
MAAYLVVNYQVDDRDEYEAYRVAGAGKALGVGSTSQMVVFDKASVALEGDAGPQTVMIRYESKAAALEAYRSEAYQAVVGKRLGSTSHHFAVVVEGAD